MVAVRITAYVRQNTESLSSSASIGFVPSLILVALVFAGSPAFATVGLESLFKGSRPSRVPDVCARIFISAPESVKLNVKDSKKLVELNGGLVSNPTDLRAESKFVVESEKVAQLIGKLKTLFGERFSSRDVAPEGYLNRTETYYSVPFEYQIKNDAGQTEFFTAKLRIRGYLLENIATGERTHSALTNGKKFLELKVKHPKFENTVYKHRLFLSDNQIRQIVDGGVLSQRATREFLIERVAKEPMNKDVNVAGILDMVRVMQESAGKKIPNFDVEAGEGTKSGSNEATGGPGFKDYVITSYAREAHRVVLTNADGKKVEIQFTFDSDVEFSTPAGLKIAALPKQVSVVEIKIPVEYASLSKKDLDRVPGLDLILNEIKDLEAVQDSRFVQNRGKFSHFGRNAFATPDQMVMVGPTHAADAGGLRERMLNLMRDDLDTDEISAAH